MARITLENGAWFDSDKARSFREGRRWDGSNHISLATGSQWNHEELYLTAGGKWILYSTSQWQGSTDHAEEITAAEAAKWFSRNEYEDSDLPAEIAEAYAALEVT